MKGVAIRAYATQYHDPIVLKQGEVVVLGAMSTEPQWPNWIWATFEGKSGWIPVQIVSAEGQVLEDYSAQELDVAVGDELELLRPLNGWFWALHLGRNQLGWVPEENVNVQTIAS
jgi:hypothetical protein